MIGTSLGSYRILTKLGEGGVGEVYRARGLRLERDVAVKILSQQFRSDPDRIARFDREARALASVNHPNIAAIYVVARKVCGGNRSKQGAQTHAVLASVLRTIQQRQLDASDIFSTLLRAPRPISALAPAISPQVESTVHLTRTH